MNTPQEAPLVNHPSRSQSTRTLATALSEYRDRHGLTQDAVASDFGIPLKAVQAWAGKDGGGKSSMAKALIACLDRL